jgi:hypothetical protein
MVTVKGRPTVRKITRDGRAPKFIEPWTFEVPENTTLHKLEDAYLNALAAVDEIKQCKADAVLSKRYTDEGIAKQVLEIAAGELAPRFKRLGCVVQAARAEAGRIVSR